MDNDSNSRQVIIEVIGWRSQPIKRISNYTIKVPYYRLSQTLQRINRQGGKIASVKVLSSVFPGTKPEPQISQKETIFTPKTTKKPAKTSRLRRRRLRRARIKMTRRIFKSRSREKSAVGNRKI